MFNHSGDVRGAGMSVARAVLDPNYRPAAPFEALPDPAWRGVFFEPDTRLQVRLEPRPNRSVMLYYGQGGELLTLDAEGVARGATSSLSRLPDGFYLRRPGDNFSNRLRPIPPDDPPKPGLPVGRFHYEELDSTFTCIESGGVLYGAFSGQFGEGEMQVMPQIGEDHWRLPMPRALDCAPPGEWMIHAHRDGGGGIASVEIGCWLARRMIFMRQA